MPNTFDKVSQYRRGKRDKFFTVLQPFIKDAGCEKHPLPFARPAKETKRHLQRFFDKVSLPVFFTARVIQELMTLSLYLGEYN